MTKVPQDRIGHAEIPRRVEADMRAASLAPDADAVSRRALLTAAALTFGVAATCMVSERATAQVKMSQKDALYQDHPKGDQSCNVCQHFQPPSSCQVVQGTISPQGWCQLFVKK
ncbi:MAG: high potential iron sulfur protein [Methylovirgula sp.]